jgi:hypothetical protein
MDDASPVCSAEESPLIDGHRPPEGAPPPVESMAAKVARLLAYGFPH